MPERMPEDMPAQVPKAVPGRIPAYLPDRTLERMLIPGKLCQRLDARKDGRCAIPDLMPEQVSGH